MQFENSFEVPLPPAEAWKVLMDIERVAPCMPGAELTGKVDDRTYRGKVGVKLGPVALSFAGTAKFEEIDDAGRQAKVRASGQDAKGRGGANALVGFRVEPFGDGSRVLIATDLNLSGAVAQYGRGAAMIQEVAAQLVRQFAAALRAQLAADRPAPVTPPVAEQSAGTAAPAADRAPAPPARPISGFGLLARVLWNSLRRLFGRKD